MNDVAIGLIGAGRIGATYAQVLASTAGVRLAGLTDRVRDRAEALGARHGAPVLPTVEALLDLDGIEAVIVCTPPDSHAELCLAAAAAGRHVLCEKPVARRTDEALAVLTAARGAGVVFTMGAKYRFVPDVRAAARMLACGRFGRPVLVENTFASRIDMRGRWNADPARSGGGVLIDNGTHSVDLLRALIGPVREVLALEAPRLQDLEVEDTVRLLARCADGTVGVVDLSWSLDPSDAAYLVIHAERGLVRLEWDGARYRSTGETDWVHFGDGYDKVDSIRAQVRNFAAAIRGTEPLWVTAEDALASVAVIDAAYRSLDSGSWTPVAELVAVPGAAGPAPDLAGPRPVEEAAG